MNCGLIAIKEYRNTFHVTCGVANIFSSRYIRLDKCEVNIAWWLRCSTAINFGNRPDDKVLRPISRSISALIGMCAFYNSRSIRR